METLAENNILKTIQDIFNYYLPMGIGDWGLGIGDWGLGIGDWGEFLIDNIKYTIEI